MREPRTFLLGTLQCRRLRFRGRRPDAAARRPAARGHARAALRGCLLAAVLRTIDGAQFMVVVDRMSAALVKGPFPPE